MLIGYGPISNADGSQLLDLQHDVLGAAWFDQQNIYEDRASGSREERPDLAACLKSRRAGYLETRPPRALAHLYGQHCERSV